MMPDPDHRHPPRLLREGRIGRLGTCLEGEPYVVPLSFVWHEGTIYFHGSRHGRKMTSLERNPRVCLEVDEAEFAGGEDPCTLHWHYESVIAWGRARVVIDEAERLDALRRLAEKYAPGTGERLTPARISEWKNLAVVAIDTDVVTRKLDPPVS